MVELTIYEAPEEELDALDPADHVRVFVEFEVQEAADKARAELNGRFFSGRKLEVLYFPLAKYVKKDF